MSAPASRLSDSTNCLIHGLPGFVVGPSSAAVLIGGFKAAIFTDGCACSALHTSVLAEGAAMVLINGLPAGRVGSKTLDGGELTQGDASVLVGGSSFAMPSFFSIEGDQAFQAKVLEHLYIISQTPTGQRMFASLAATGHKVRIQFGTEADNTSNRGLTMTDPTLPPAYPGGRPRNDPRSEDGTGIDSVVKYDPYRTDYGIQSGAPPWSKPPNYTPEVTLVHELVHADDMAHGTADSSPCLNPGGTSYHVQCGERRATGLSPYDDESKYPFSENTYRRDRGYAQPPVY
jgi:uncharacterized Zn-binding protein involved in type VI secretion